MIISVHTTHLRYASRIQYVLDFVNLHPATPKDVQLKLNAMESNLEVHYGDEAKPIYFVIPRQDLIFSDQLYSSDALHANPYMYNDLRLHSVEIAKKAESPFHQKSFYSFDIIETIFFHISRYEEYYATDDKKDKWDMLHESHHFMVAHQIYQYPVVDRLVRSWLLSMGIEPLRYQTQYTLTHDIDVLRKFRTPYRSSRAIARTAVDRGLAAASRLARLYADVKKNKVSDPYDTFDWLILNKTTDRVVRKIMFVMTGGETHRDNHYSVSDPEFQKHLTMAQARGYEIGLHPSYNAAEKAPLYASEKESLEQLLEQEVVWSRQHFLHWFWDKTPSILRDNGIQHDSTLGYQRLIGFRCGTGHAYKLYDFVEEKSLDIIEEPMVIMDGALETEMGLDLTQVEQQLHQFLSLNDQNTHINFNFHNTFFDPSKRSEQKWKELYLGLFSEK